MRLTVRSILSFLLLFSVTAPYVPASQMTRDASEPATRAVSCEEDTLSPGGRAAKDKDEKKLHDSSPLIALTFDDGPSTKFTNRILDLLEINGGKATFFVLGVNIEKHAEVMVRAYSMGCEIGNHTYSHRNLTKLSGDEIREELSKTDDLILELLLEDPKYMRVPACHYNHAVKAAVKMPIILWSIDTGDWRFGVKRGANTKQNRRRIVDNVLNKAQDGDIILMHDIYSFTADLCEELIPELRAAGFKLVTVSELFSQKGIEPKSGNVYYKAKNVDP
ncbi:MAG: polysaccharide deacetylase family protein [Oscillospiraceae bacterium]|nr:polysaccharide deacetylase family protein [Oscillospiraceae bacterium]